MDKPVQITRIAKSEFNEVIRNLFAEKDERVLEPQLPLLKLSKYLRDRLDVDGEKAIPECVSCGACCNYAMIAPVTQLEAQQLDAVIEVTLDGTGDRVTIDAVLPRNEKTGSCVNLNGEL